MPTEMRRPRNPSTPRPGPGGDATPPFSPTFSRTAFPAAAVAATDVSEHPLVTLYEWWLASVEGDDRKIAVGGFFERNQADLEFSAPIAKRHQGCILETEDGVVVDIHGTFNVDRTMNNGFTVELCQEFLLGFPYWWEKWNERYPKVMASQTGAQPSSCRTNKSREDSTRFYLEQFQIGKYVTSVGSIICNGNAEAFPDCSCLPDGTPRFEEYTRVDDIPMRETAAASNCNTERRADVCSVVENMEVVLIGGTTSKERSDGIDSNVPSSPAVDCTNNKSNAGGPNKGRQKTPMASSKRRGCMKKPQRIALNGKAVPGEADRALAHSNVQSSEEVRSHDGIDSNVPSAPAVECTNDKSNAGADNASRRNKGREKTPVASSKRRGSMKKSQRIALNEKAVPGEAAPALAHSNVQSSEDVRSHDGFDTNVPSAPGVERTNDESNARSDNASRRNRGHQKTPVASSNRRGCMKKPQRTALNEKGKQPVGPSRKQRSASGKLQHATRSPTNIRPIPYGDQSPLTCGWPKSLTVSTPESLKLKKTRSGRVVVPTLNSGCQSIAYAHDGSISAIIVMDSPPPPKGNTSKTDARKKKRTH